MKANKNKAANGRISGNDPPNLEIQATQNANTPRTTKNKTYDAVSNRWLGLEAFISNSEQAARFAACLG
jgi:hypothetical protein